MKKFFSLKHLFVLDLIVVSIYAFCATYCSPRAFFGYGFLFAFLILRLGMSFMLYRRKSLTVVPIALYLLVIIALLSTEHTHFVWWGITYPVLMLLDRTFALLTGNTLFSDSIYTNYASYLYESHLHDLSPSFGVCLLYLWIALWLLWCFVLPIVVYLVMLFTHRLGKPRFDKHWYRDRALHFYFAYLAIFLFASSFGSRLSHHASFAVVALMPLFYWLFSYHTLPTEAEFNRRQGAWITLAAVLFSIAQVVLRLPLLLAVVVLVAWVAYRYYRRSHRLLSALALFAVLSFILPTITLGYNQFRYLEMSRNLCGDVNILSQPGLLVVDNHKGGEGLRDRYGMVMHRISYGGLRMMDPEKPFIRGRNETGDYFLYDIVAQRTIVDGCENITLNRPEDYKSYGQIVCTYPSGQTDTLLYKYYYEANRADNVTSPSLQIEQK